MAKKGIHQAVQSKTHEKGVVKSVWRAIRMLESFDREDGMSVTELSKKLNFPKSSVHEILMTLVHEGILEKDGDRNRYSLGTKLFELGNRARAGLEIRKVAAPFLKALNGDLDETVHLTVLDNGEVLYVECFASTKRLRTYSVIGIRAPLHCTAVGKAILAFLPRNDLEWIVRTKRLERFTENTITDKGRLVEDLKKITQRGYAVDNMEHEEGVRCVGAPIKNHSGVVCASISVSGPSQRITLDRIPQIARMVVSTANEISKRLGYVST